MIYCPIERLLYLEIPKNASSTVASILLDQLGGHRVLSPPLAGAPSWSNGLATHRMEWASEFHPNDVTVFTTIRHPLERAFSLWDHFCIRHASVFGWPSLTTTGEPYDFTDFARWLATAGPEYPYPKKGKSEWFEEQSRAFLAQWELLRHVHVDVFVRVAHLADDLARVWISRDQLAEAGHRNQGSHARPRQATLAAKSFVERWGVGDFHLLHLADQGNAWRPIA